MVVHQCMANSIAVELPELLASPRRNIASSRLRLDIFVLDRMELYEVLTLFSKLLGALRGILSLNCWSGRQEGLWEFDVRMQSFGFTFQTADIDHQTGAF